MFFAVNMMNNYAFGYKISVPVHIILRSGGSVMTMVVGYIWGKRYSGVQGQSHPLPSAKPDCLWWSVVMSVTMLTIGIVIAAMADAQAKVRYPSYTQSYGKIAGTLLLQNSADGQYAG